MIAAIYARKSTDQSDRGEDEKSVTRQIEHATTYATRKGWTVASAHVFVDDSMSGAEFVKRRGFLALMNALTPRPPFQVLVVMDQSRLGRSLDEVPFAIKRIADAGVRIFQYLSDSEVKRENAADKFMIHAIAFVDDMHRQQSRERTHDALRRKMLAGHVTGGTVYGYRNVDVLGPTGTRAHVRREIDPAQAAVVRRLFERTAAGLGYQRLAHELNGEAVPAPRAGGSWAPSAIYAMLHRELYVGRVVWNKTGWVDRGGTKVKVDRPESEWLVREAPELRIIPEALWQAAHARLRDTATAWKAGRPTWGRPPVAIQARYLLTGFTECGRCGGSMLAWRRATGHGAPAFRCSYHHYRGARICPNARTVSVEIATTAVLEGVRAQALAPEILGPAIRETIAQYQARAATPGSRRALERSLERVRRELARLTAALASGAALPSVLEALREREAQRTALEAQLGALAALERTARGWDAHTLDRILRARVTRWQALLEGNLDEGRQVLRQLLPERLRFTPRATRGYEITGTLALGGLLSAVVEDGPQVWGPQELVPPG
jgi:site-specific DNA recombinase